MISIAAGVKIEAIEAMLGETVPIIRAMPNTPCAIGQRHDRGVAGSRMRRTPTSPLA